MKRNLKRTIHRQTEKYDTEGAHRKRETVPETETEKEKYKEEEKDIETQKRKIQRQRQRMKKEITRHNIKIHIQTNATKSHINTHIYRETRQRENLTYTETETYIN